MDRRRIWANKKAAACAAAGGASVHIDLQISALCLQLIPEGGPQTAQLLCVETQCDHNSHQSQQADDDTKVIRLFHINTSRF